VKKSRREKAKDAAEARKREEEENAARAYAEFLDEFEGEDVGRRKSGSAFVKASTGSNAPYVYPSKNKVESSSRSSGHPRVSRSHHLFKHSHEGSHCEKPPSPPAPSAPKPKGKRAMDAFLEEIKRYIRCELEMFA
jgi:U2-associated protein SR140